MNGSVAIQVLPNGVDKEKLISIVDDVIEYIKSTGINYQVSAFETTIEGDYEELMDIVKKCQYIAIESGAESVSSYVKIVYSPKKDILTIDEKVNKHK